MVNYMKWNLQHKVDQMVNEVDVVVPHVLDDEITMKRFYNLLVDRLNNIELGDAEGISSDVENELQAIRLLLADISRRLEELDGGIDDLNDAIGTLGGITYFLELGRLVVICNNTWNPQGPEVAFTLYEIDEDFNRILVTVVPTDMKITIENGTISGGTELVEGDTIPSTINVSGVKSATDTTVVRIVKASTGAPFIYQVISYTIEGKDGESAQYNEFAYSNNNTGPTEDGSYDGTTFTYPTDWYDNPDDPAIDDTHAIFMSRSTWTYNSGVWGITIEGWSSPARWDGTNGEDGITNTAFISTSGPVTYVKDSAGHWTDTSDTVVYGNFDIDGTVVQASVNFDLNTSNGDITMTDNSTHADIAIVKTNNTSPAPKVQFTHTPTGMELSQTCVTIIWGEDGDPGSPGDRGSIAVKYDIQDSIYYTDITLTSSTDIDYYRYAGGGWASTGYNIWGFISNKLTTMGFNDQVLGDSFEFTLYQSTSGDPVAVITAQCKQSYSSHYSGYWEFNFHLIVHGSMLVEGTVQADTLAAGALDISSEAEVDNGNNGLLARIADTGNSQSLDGGLEVGIYCNNSAWAGYFINGHTKPTMVLVNAGTSCNGANRSPILNGGKAALFGSSIPAYTLQIFNDGDIETEGSGSFESGLKAPGSYFGYQQDVYPDFAAYVKFDMSDGSILANRGSFTLTDKGVGHWEVKMNGRQFPNTNSLAILVNGSESGPHEHPTTLNAYATADDTIRVQAWVISDTSFAPLDLHEVTIGFIGEAS